MLGVFSRPSRVLAVSSAESARGPHRPVEVTLNFIGVG
jgi:hypothetical protein